MKVFSYQEYIKSIHTLRLNAVLRLAEETTEYKIERKQTDKKHDKLIKTILKEKQEMAKMINQFIMTKEKIEKEELIKCTNSYITNKYKTKEADMVYKLKNKDIYFLVEHQSSVDNTMPYRLLNYCIDIIQEWGKNRKGNKKEYYPIVVPIVIYTGSQKWKVTTNFKNKQISTAVFENYKIDFKYNLIDINKLSNQTLLESNSMFGYGMLIEKSKNKQELRKNIEKMIDIEKDKEKIDELANIIVYLLNDVLEETEQEELLSKINGKVGEESMSTLYDRLLEENKRILNQGRREGKMEGRREGILEGKLEGKIEMIKNLIKMNMKEEDIIKASEIDKQEFEKIKQELVMVK